MILTSCIGLCTAVKPLKCEIHKIHFWNDSNVSAISGVRPGDPPITWNKMKLCTPLYTQHLFEPICRWDKKDRCYQPGLQQSI